MNYYATDWAGLFNSLGPSFSKEKDPGSAEAREMWDKKAASFTHKPKRSGYLAQFVELLNAQPGQTVFDMGCGPGTLAIPLAKAGCNVFAIDFSSGMLGELQSAAKAEGVEVVSGEVAVQAAARMQESCAGATEDKDCGTIFAIQRSWQDSWDDLPVADIALSSRSLIATSKTEALAKLQAHARSRVVVTVGAGDLPYRDHRVYEAMGRPDQSMPPFELVYLVNYLFSQGHLPSVRYIRTESSWHRATRQDLIDAIRETHEPQTPEQQTALDAFLDEHIVYNEQNDNYEMDYPRIDSWAFIEWEPN